MSGISHHFQYLLRSIPSLQRNELNRVWDRASRRLKKIYVTMDNYVFQNDDNRGIQRPYTINNRSHPRTFNNDYLVEVNSRANKFKRTVFFKRLSIGFLILALLFFIIMVVFIFLYLQKSEPKICTSKECLKTANNFLSSMDYTVDPCDNFYKFVCGRWSEEHPNHGWWNSFSSFTTIGEKVAITSMNVLNDANNPNEPEAIKKSRLFYNSCLDIETLDELGIATIYPFLKNMELPIIPSFMTMKDKTNVTFNWLRADALAKKNLLMDVFIGATVGPNIFNGSENVLYIGQIYQTSPLPSPLKKKWKGILRKDSDKEGVKESVRDANSNLIKYLINAVILNNTGQEAEDDLLEKATIIIMDMSDLIDEIVANTTSPGVQDDETYTITVEHLEKEINIFLNKPSKNVLINYLNYLFDGTNVTVNPKSDLLYVTDLDIIFLKMIVKYLTEIPDVNIELYMWWTTVYAMIFNTSNEIAEYITKQLNFFSSDSESIVRSRSLECALLTNNYMGYAISYALADQLFQNTTKPKVERMVMEIKESFESQVNGISWMDSKTKKATLEKSKQMMTFIGYPDWLFENGKLDKYYSNMIIKPNRYLENMVNIIRSHAKDNLNSLRKPHKRDWYSEPIEVNAFNSFSDNAINIPMAILNFPLYHLGLEVLNYGSIGSILGHELIHGFDNTGRKHDKYGNYVQWWTNETIEAFENFTDCFVKQYENFTIPGVESHINGKVTLGENLADSGGLNQAFRAYTKYVSKYGEEPKLPGFEKYSSYQLFFIAYASVWCETINFQQLTQQILLDVHSPSTIRVLVNLQNSEEFAETYHCPTGSLMNPEKKCKIW